MSRSKIALALAAVAVVGGGAAYAAIPDAEGVVHGCRNSGSGLLRVIASGETCKSNETALDWVPSAGWEVYRSFGFASPVEVTAVVPDPPQHVMTLKLAPGSYEINAYIEIQKDSGDGVVACFTQTAPGFAPVVLRAAMGTAPGDSRWLTLSGSGLAALPNGGDAELLCRQRPGATGAHPVVVEADVSAVRIGSIDQKEDGS